VELDRHVRLTFHWRPAAVVLAGLVLMACTSSVPPLTPEPQPSVAADEGLEAAEVVDAFLALMADPKVTYRVESEVDMGDDGQGGAAIALRGRYDVAGDDYAGQGESTAVVLDDPNGGVSFLVIDGEAHVRDFSDVWITVSDPDLGYRPNAVADIAAEDLAFSGRTEDGLFEFDVRPWLFEDPIATWSALGGFDEQAVPTTTMESHRTRLLLDGDGVPVQLTSSWTFWTEDAERANASLLHRLSDFGLYVSIPEDFEQALFLNTSHDIGFHVDETNTPIREPWYDVAPGPGDPTAELDVAVEFSADEPVMLGMEGAIYFLGSRDADGMLVLDALVPFEGGVVSAPTGEQTLEAYYRTCSGSCGYLDPPTTFCTTETTLEAGAQYELRVVITGGDPLVAECSVTSLTGVLP